MYSKMSNILHLSDQESDLEIEIEIESENESENKNYGIEKVHTNCSSGYVSTTESTKCNAGTESESDSHDWNWPDWKEDENFRK